MILKEDQRTELKENPRSGTLVNDIVAFLNTCDGDIYIGVTKAGKVVGLDDMDRESINVSNIINDQIEPSPRGLISTDTPTIDGKQVIQLHIRKGNRLFYVKKYGMSSAGCYERVGTTGRGMNPDQIRSRMIASIRAELKITAIPSGEKDLSFRMIQFLYAQEGLTVNEKSFCKNEGFFTESGEYNVLAELLADKNRFSIKVVRYKGNDKGTEMLLRNEYGEQCLIIAMKNAQNFCSEVLNQTKTVFHRDGYREDVFLFDRNAFREAWYNACLHNDWAGGTPPAIYVFNDRLQIVSNGGLPYNMTKEDFFGGISRPVNESLAKIFIKLGLIEQTGHGVSTIVDKYGRKAFTFLDSALIVTIPFSYHLDAYIKPTESNKNGDVPSGGISNGISDGISDGISNGISTNQKKNQESDIEILIDAIKKNPKITIKEMMKLIGKSQRTVARILAKDERIIRVGTTFDGYWKIRD